MTSCGTTHVRFQFRRARADQWSDPLNNPVLQAGEPGYELPENPGMTGRLKLGDGSQKWRDLPYLNLEGSTGPTGAVGSQGPPGPASTVTGPTGPASSGGAGTYALIQVYDDGTKYDVSSTSTITNVPASFGTFSSISPDSFRIILNSKYTLSNPPLISVNAIYLTAANELLYTSVKVGNTTGAILTKLDLISSTKTLTVSSISRTIFNSPLPSTNSGTNLYLYIQVLN